VVFLVFGFVFTDPSEAELMDHHFISTRPVSDAFNMDKSTGDRHGRHTSLIAFVWLEIDTMRTRPQGDTTQKWVVERMLFKI
jgi:hypothetical protein